MPTDIPALIDTLNRYSCQEHTALGDDEGCVACEVWRDMRNAAAALAEQAEEIEDAWGVADTQRAQLNALTNLEDWPCACCSEDKRDAVCLVHSPHVIALRAQLAEAREVVQDIKNHGGGDDSYLYCWERARQWLASTEEQ